MVGIRHRAIQLLHNVTTQTYRGPKPIFDPDTKIKYASTPLLPQVISVRAEKHKVSFDPPHQNQIDFETHTTAKPFSNPLHNTNTKIKTTSIPPR